MSYIYKIVNDINDKVYIGKTNFSIEKRFKQHCKDAFRDRNEKRPLYSAMRKYGIEHFQIELIEETDNPNEREIYWIDFFEGYTKGYNATRGGEGKNRYDHQEIISRLKIHPYPCDIAQEFGCSRHLVYKLAKQYDIPTKSKSQERLQEKSKSISAYTESGEFIKNFPSTAEAARWCFQCGKCATLGSGTRSHISDVAKGRRKTAYSYVWKYE